MLKAQIPRLSGWMSGLLAVFLATSIPAQDKSKYFTVMHPENFSIDWTGFYAESDRKTAEIREMFPNHLDIPYGRHAKQKMDLYLPKGKIQDAPVFIFIHGGGFREGDRAHYGFVAGPLARHGAITVVPSYRLTGQGFHYPDQPHDIQDVLTWVYKNIGKHGGSRERIFIGGHSAGAILSATVSVWTDWLAERGLPEDLVKGCLPISGPYDLRVGAYEEREGEADAYVNRPELRASASPVANVRNPPPRTLVAIGSLEPKYMDSSRAFVDKLREKGVRAELMILDGMDHNHTAATLSDEKSRLTQALLKMIRGR